MNRIIFGFLLIITLPVDANNEFGGFGKLLEKINIDASYLNTKQKAIESLKEIPAKYVATFSKHAYKRFLKSQSQSDYTGILDIINPSLLSEVVENVMLTESYGYDYLDHEFYLSNTSGIEFKEYSSVYKIIQKSIKDPCELAVWNAIYLAKGHRNLRHESDCKIINDLTNNKTKYTNSELVNIYYRFRDIDGY